MLLMIDNYDSFTYNLVQYFGELGQAVEVYRNDQINLAEIEAKKPHYLVISPGPCTPNEAGISLAVVDYFKDKVPLLGVCLGHQSIVQAFGGNIVQANDIMHGKRSQIYHNNGGLFSGLPQAFNATRYHSLVAFKTTVPECLEVNAWTQNEDGTVDEVMAVRHKTLAIEGVQFHPESILTEHGYPLLKNFLTRYAQ